MPGVELGTSACDGHVVVALRGELDVTGAAEAETAITAPVARDQYLVINMSTLDFIDCHPLGALLRARELARHGGGDMVLAAPQPYSRRLLVLTGQDEAFWVQASVYAAVAYRQATEAIPLAAACGAHCTPWEGSAIAYWHRVTAAGVRVGLESSVPGRTRR